MTEQTGNNKPNEAEALAFPLSGNEKLIEEALVAYWGAMNAHVYGSVAGMRAAFAVFEKALTPTDDEQEALLAEADRWPAGLPDDPTPAASPHDLIGRLATTEEVRGWYAGARHVFGDPERQHPDMVAEFDRWLAAHDAEVRAVERERIIRDMQERSHPDDWGVPCVYVQSYAEQLRGEKR